jgi:hypothetical protein
MKQRLTVIINPRVFDFLNLVPAIWPTLAVEHDIAGVVCVTFEFRAKMEGNHGWLVVIWLERAINA